MTAPPFDDVLEAVAEPGRYECWRDEFEQSRDYLDAADLAVPRGDALARSCRALRFPEVATRLLVAHRGSFDGDAARRLGAHVQWLVWERYDPLEHIMLGWPPAPARCRLLYAYAFLGLSPRTRGYHRRYGVGGDVTADTLWDIGQQVALHHRDHGEPGMDKGWWLAHHLAGYLYRLGRLQFQRAWFPIDTGPLPKGTAYLDVHIPEGGPLTPAACDEAFAAAREFFPAHFPADGAEWFACFSWLLDPQLEHVLPADSNIRAFQRRFEIVHVQERGGSGVFEFVFGRPDLDRADAPDLDGLPRDTSLERAIVDFYAAGGRLHRGFGLIPIPPAVAEGAEP